jgi:predicted TPR repeat methyltransferase
MAAIDDTLREAMQAHGAGQLEAARALYQRLLDTAPQHPDGLHLMGVLQAQCGQHELAAELIGRAIAVQPQEAMFHNNLGNVYIERGRFDDALQHYQQAITLDPGRVDAMNNLGVLYGQMRRHAEAEQTLLKVVELAPEFADARQNLANFYLRAGRPSDAVQQCMDGLITAPRNTALRRVLGAAYSAMGMRDEAIGVYRAWLEAEPDNPVAMFHLQACTGENVPERAPDAYVANIFDSFANSFDAKLGSLSYQGPQLVAGAVARHAGPPERRLQVLDGGCGTGLCGPLMVPYAQRLEGVDLSERMLRKALVRKVYDELVCAELVAFLQSRVAAYDLIVSVDTLCYFGALERFAAGAAAALRGPRLLVFTVEAHADDDSAPDYRLQDHGRYSHRRRYVESALAGAGLSLLEMQSVVLRTEAGQPVPGWLVTARADRSP